MVLKLALLYVNVPETAVDSMISTIEEMESQVRTAFGLSKASYGGPAANLLHGSKQ